MQSQYYWGSPAAGLHSQGRSLAKLKLQGDMLVFGPFVSAEMYTDQAHIPYLGASSSAAFGPSLEAPESLLRL